MTNDVFVSKTPQTYSSSVTHVAKSGDFLVAKQSSHRSLGLIPICAYKYSYKEGSFQCSPCERGLKSFGLQDEQCITCMRAWLLSSGDNFRQAQYERFCQDGSVFSIILLIVVPIVTLVVAFICCCCTTANGLKNGHGVCEDDKNRHKRAKLTRRRTMQGNKR